ncbi:hypothetical protein [Haloarcula sp. CGMCC 1.6347]|uniref:hypothetical protein n=1 Tax=Haloarcula sp. CGMCC 1.6347 TaxID=3111455 RepID=UPI00300E7D46
MMSNTSKGGAKNSNKYYVVWKVTYGGWDKTLVSNTPVTAKKANNLIMKGSLNYVTNHGTSIKNVDNSGPVHSVMANPLTGSKPIKWYAKGYDSYSAANKAINNFDPRDV